MRRLSGLAVLGLLLGVQQASAVIVAYDDASDAAYNSGWTNGSNGGFGFTAWSFPPNSGGNHTIASSMGNGAGGGPGIDTAGARSWAFQSNTMNEFPTAFRGWTHTFAVGDKLSIDLDMGWIGSGVLQQFGVYGQSGTQVFITSNSSSGNYQLLETSTWHDTGIAVTDGGLHLDFTWTSTNNVLVDITELSTNTTSSFNLAVNLPIGMAMQSIGGMPGQDFYLNSMQIDAVPEPGTMAVLAVGGLALIRRRTRR